MAAVCSGVYLRTTPNQALHGPADAAVAHILGTGNSPGAGGSEGQALAMPYCSHSAIPCSFALNFPFAALLRAPRILQELLSG